MVEKELVVRVELVVLSSGTVVDFDFVNLMFLQFPYSESIITYG